MNRAAALVAAVAYGLACLKQGYDAPAVGAGAPSPLLLDGVLHLLLLAPSLLLLQALVARHALARLGSAAAARFHRLEPWSYAVWIAGAALVPRVGGSSGFTLALLAAQLALQAWMFRRALGAALLEPVNALAGLFLVSGFAALIYQVVWQRMLFTQFGVNSESVTAIVSVFMFGLGVGALAGGWLQQRFPAHLVRIFIAIEAGIGLYGLASAQLIAAANPGDEPSMASLVGRVYAVLGPPTLLMGATLPVLTSYFQRRLRDIGRTVGLLYAVNTFGSALAAFATVQVLFVLLGLHASLVVAAACNFLTAWLVWRVSRRLPAEEVAAQAPGEAPAGARALSYPLAFLALAAIGFISLSFEILWFRLVGFLTASRPEVFGMLLAAFLVGIAAGSMRARRFAHDDAAARSQAARDLLAAAMLAYLAVPAVSWITALTNKPLGAMAAYAGAGLVAFWCGGVLPSLVQLATRDKQGASATHVAWLYFANIVGAALGPLATGFVLLERFGLAANMAVLAAVTSALALLLAPGALRARRAIGVALAALAAWAVYPWLYAGHLERLQHASVAPQAFVHVREDRTAIITVDRMQGGDIVYGHGIYDGRFNVDPVVNSNMIDRAYMMAALHREPRRVLEIGLSAGSWAKVLASHDALKELVVVEIGRSYAPLVALYPAVAPVLRDPRVRIHVDDGRRWLKNHPHERFDFILMNNSFPWRSNATHLLSREFLELARAHLNPGGVMYWNGVGLDDLPYTAAGVFRHVTRFSTFVAASDAPFDMTPAERRANLLRFRGADATSVFDASEAHRTKLAELARARLEDLAPSLRLRRDLWVLTDDNMASEFKVRY